MLGTGCRQGDDEVLLTCHACHQRHHAVCYGFTGIHDPRLPSQFICIQCTPGDKQPDKRVFADLALWRRCLYHAMHGGGAVSDSELAKTTGR